MMRRRREEEEEEEEEEGVFEENGKGFRKRSRRSS
jgi:hypothetical protein